MRVLIEGSGAPLGAAGFTRLKELARALPAVRPQHEFVFVVRHQVALVIREMVPSARLWPLPAAFNHATLRLAWLHSALPFLARRLRPDVVFAPFNIVPRFWGRPRPALAVMLSNLAPYSEVALARCRGRELWRNWALRRATDRSVQRADRVFVQSQQAFDLVPIPGLREKAVIVPPPAPPPEPTATGSAGAPQGPYLLVVGDLNSYKGVETVIDAVAVLRHAPALIVCGHPREPEYARSLGELAQLRGVGERVRFMGSMPHDDVLALMRDAIACVASSRFENFSRVPGEAMSVGTPVVARDIQPYREACGDAALYFDDDPEILAGHLEELIANPRVQEERARLGLDHGVRTRSEAAPELIVESLERLVAVRPQG